MSLTGDLRGDYRIANDALAVYELYRGVDAAPDLGGSPWETFASLPHTTAALDVSHTYRFVLRLRNRYKLVTQNIDEWSVTLDAGGNQVATPPSAPQEITLVPAAAGAVRVRANYYYLEDGSDAADTFLIYLRSDGTNPDPSVDTPTTIAMVKADGIAKLNWTSGTFAHGTTIKVIVRSRRTGTPNIDSTNLDIYTTTASTAGPAAPERATTHIGAVAEQIN